MSGPYNLEYHEAYPPFDGDPGALDAERGSDDVGSVSQALIIWVPAGGLAILLILASVPVYGIILLGGAFMLHSVMRPQVSVYALIATIPLSWMVSVLPEITSITKLVGFVALLFTLPRIPKAVSPARWDPCAKWILGLVLWALLSLAWSVNSEFCLLVWQTLALNWGMVILIGLQIDTRGKLNTASLIYIGSCTVSNLVLLLTGDVGEITSGIERPHLISYLGESLANNNTMAFIFGIATVLCIHQIVAHRRLVLRLVFATCLLTLLLGLLMLKSRGVWVAAVSSLAGGILFLRGGGIGKRIILMVVIGVLTLVGFFTATKLGFLGEGVQQRVDSIFEQGFEAGNRINLWRAHAEAFVATGGIGNGYGQTSLRTIYVAHNDWFSIAGDLGAVGLLCFAGFHLMLFRRIRNMVQIWPKFSCIMLWVFIFVAPLTADSFNKTRFTLAVGLILATIRLDERQRAHATDFPTVDAA